MQYQLRTRAWINRHRGVGGTDKLVRPTILQPVTLWVSFS